MATFPGRFAAIKAASGIIKDVAKGRQYLNHIINTIMLPANINYGAEHAKLLGLKHKLNVLGAVPFFITAKKIRNNILQLEILGTDISYEQIMALAIIAFKIVVMTLKW